MLLQYMEVLCSCYLFLFSFIIGPIAYNGTSIYGVATEESNVPKGILTNEVSHKQRISRGRPTKYTQKTPTLIQEHPLSTH